jgi:hypothetical protein
MGAGAPPPGAAAVASGLPSDDTHELGGDAVDEDEEDTRRGDVVARPLLPLSPPGRAVAEGPPLALDRPILRSSSFDALPLFLLIVAAAAAAQVAITEAHSSHDVSYSVAAHTSRAAFGRSAHHALGITFGLGGLQLSTWLGV